MDEQTRESVIEITLHALDEVLPKGRLPRAETHKLLNDLITVVTRAKCGYRFDSKPFDQEIPCT